MKGREKDIEKVRKQQTEEMEKEKEKEREKEIDHEEFLHLLGLRDLREMALVSPSPLTLSSSLTSLPSSTLTTRANGSSTCAQKCFFFFFFAPRIFFSLSLWHFCVGHVRNTLRETRVKGPRRNSASKVTRSMMNFYLFISEHFTGIRVGFEHSDGILIIKFFFTSKLLLQPRSRSPTKLISTPSRETATTLEIAKTLTTFLRISPLGRNFAN